MSNSVPELAKGSKVLVSGASGFIAVHVVDELLKDGFEVVGTVRSAAKGDYLKDLFKGKPFSYVIVEDIGKDGAFDEAVKGVQGVAHTASPFHLKADDPEELIRPAVDGTIGILKSITKNGSDVKRVVVTSSVAAVAGDKTAPYTYTEDDWNDVSIKIVEEKGKDADGGHKYRASKTLAEKAAWDYSKENNVSYGLSTINPPFVFGPILHQVDKPESLNTSVANFYGILKGSKKEEDLPGPFGNWIDVREVALAHVKALTVPEAVGERFIISAGPFCIQDLTESILSIAPDTPGVPKGKPGAAKETTDPSKMTVCSGAKAGKILGIKYRSIEDSAKDMYDSLKAKGW
ncbi:d-lactaldehyde dehydrogenase [Phaffia rhodozyma]|uniref:D-lactaldehyde dehydrogenase n=1 Tax=Phaffia rhodozyma TaxID=264483 RepID=A0A0F7SJ12_PHARH|nr:d-lactaldehyde dehydrogenase [Phaffia rhodozyma]